VTMKTCKEIHAAHRAALRAAYERFHQEMRTASLEEFPTGAKVTWRFPHRREDSTGEVTGRLADDPACITVRSGNGSGHTINAWELTRVYDS
jgi:hypothetical protein